MKFSFVFSLLLWSLAGFAQSETALLKKADSLADINKTSEAILLYSKIIKTNPRNETALKQRANAYVKLNRFKEGEKDYRDLLKLNASCSECLSYLAISKLLQNQLDSAVLLSDKAV